MEKNEKLQPIEIDRPRDMNDFLNCGYIPWLVVFKSKKTEKIEARIWFSVNKNKDTAKAVFETAFSSRGELLRFLPDTGNNMYYDDDDLPF